MPENPPVPAVSENVRGSSAIHTMRRRIPIPFNGPSARLSKNIRIPSQGKHMIRLSRFIVVGWTITAAACTTRATPGSTPAIQPALSNMRLELAADSQGEYEVTAGQFCEVLNWAIEKGYAKIINGDLRMQPKHTPTWGSPMWTG
jgi:hypothetical protein